MRKKDCKTPHDSAPRRDKCINPKPNLKIWKLTQTLTIVLFRFFPEKIIQYTMWLATAQATLLCKKKFTYKIRNGINLPWICHNAALCFVKA